MSLALQCRATNKSTTNQSFPVESMSTLLAVGGKRKLLNLSCFDENTDFVLNEIEWLCSSDDDMVGDKVVTLIFGQAIPERGRTWSHS